MNQTFASNRVIKALATLAIFATAACATPAFDFEAWHAAKLEELQPHPLETSTPIPPLTVPWPVLDGPLDRRVEVVAPDLAGRIVGERIATAAFSRATSVTYDEGPVAIAGGVCRALSHRFTAYPRPPQPGDASLVFTRRSSHVSFFAADVDGACPYRAEVRGFSAASDARAISLIAAARTAARNLRDGRLQIRCDESFPACATPLKAAFNIHMIRWAGSCETDLRCMAFDLPGVDPANYGIRLEMPADGATITVSALSPPLLP